MTVRILISSAGRRVALMNCFRNAARELGIRMKIVAVDMDPEWSPACQTADTAYKVPSCRHTDFIHAIAEISDVQNIDLIVPTIDTELQIYAENRDVLNRIGTEILISDGEVIRIARDKAKTAAVLKAHDIKTPDTWGIKEFRDRLKNIRFPIIAKPIDGSRSQGICQFASASDFKAQAIDFKDRYIFQEVCIGEEYTINAFFDRTGAYRACVPHMREMVRDGEVCFAETVRIPEFTSVAEKMETLFDGLWGNICFQAFFDEVKREATVFEINARFGGGYPICDRAGGSYAKWILQELIGERPDYHDDWQEGIRMLRYDEAIFIQETAR